MPRTKATAAASEEAEQKPKRKYARKKNIASADESVADNSAAQTNDQNTKALDQKINDIEAELAARVSELTAEMQKSDLKKDSASVQKEQIKQDLPAEVPQEHVSMEEPVQISASQNLEPQGQNPKIEIQEAQEPQIKEQPKEKKPMSDISIKSDKIENANKENTANVQNIDPVPDDSLATAFAQKSKISAINSNKSFPQPVSEKDAEFLAPANTSFGLKPKEKSEKIGWVRVLMYFLSGLIILMAIALFVLTFYPSKLGALFLWNKKADKIVQSSASSQGNPKAASAPTTTKLVIVNAGTDINSLIASAVQQKFAGQITIDNPSGLVSLPAENSDTLFFKQSAQSQVQNVLSLLAQYNIKPQIQSSENINDDMALYLVSALQSADLSSATASVYNATGVSGLAKKYCGYLANYKVSSCSALNATQKQAGMAVYYKDQNLLAIIERLPELQKASFVKADPSQVEDIKVVVGN